jgi:hypothetical protein
MGRPFLLFGGFGLRRVEAVRIALRTCPTQGLEKAISEVDIVFYTGSKKPARRADGEREIVRAAKEGRPGWDGLFAVFRV